MKSAKPTALLDAAFAALGRVCTGATTGKGIPAYAHPSTAAVAVDLQRDFLSEQGRLPIARSQIQGVVRASNRVLHAAAARTWQVVYIGNEFSTSDVLANAVRRGAALRGSSGAAIDDRIVQVPGAYFSKESRDAFGNQALDEHLRRLEIDRLILFGVMANACVRATALGALNRGYKVTVVRDATGAPTDRARDAAIDALARAGASITTANDLVGRPDQASSPAPSA